MFGELQELSEAPRAHVATRDDDADPLRAERARVNECGGDGARSAWLDDDLESLEKELHRVRDVCVLDEEDVVYEPAHHGERLRSRARDELAVGDRARPGMPDSRARRQRLLRIVGAGGLDADDARAW